MTIPRWFLTVILCAVATATAAAQADDDAQNRWTARVSPGIGGANDGGLLTQTTAWFTWDRLALGLRRGTAASFLAIFEPSYEVREQSALIGYARRKGHRTALYAIGIGQASGNGGYDGGYDGGCFIFWCSYGLPRCIKAGDPSNGCRLTPQLGLAAAAEFGLHFRYVGFGVAYNLVATEQVRIVGAAVVVQVGNMPTRRP